MEVLSLFDGMSCGRIALERAGIPVTNYYASEIDKHAIAVSKANYPDIIQLGSVTDLINIDWNKTKIDLLIGGSPCQGFSFAGRQLNFDDHRSKLFFEYVRLLKEIRLANPKVKFLLENVKMKKEYQAVISEHLGVSPLKINSRTVSAQNREHLYWTNIEGVSVPEDRGILLKDILLADFDEKYLHTQKGIEYMNQPIKGGRENRYKFGYTSYSNMDKSACITASIHKGVPYNTLIIREATKKGFIEVEEGQCFDTTFPESKTRRGRLMLEKSNCLTAAKFDYMQYLKGDILRRFTPVECERLQTVPDNYTKSASDTQRYKMLGNGWTVDVIVEFFKNLQYNFNENLDF